jgi:hypothetical protein
MKLFGFSLLACLLVSSVSFAVGYECEVLRIGQDGFTSVGKMQIETQAGDMKQVYLNQAKDFCACVGIPADQQAPSQIGCVFASGGSEVKLRKLNKGRYMAIQRQKTTGQITTMPVAFAGTGAEHLSLMIPNADATKLYMVACMKPAPIRR